MIKRIGTVLAFSLMLAISAQASQKIDISFPFNTPAGELPAGRYVVDMRNLASSKLIQLTHMDTKRSVVFLPVGLLNERSAAESARMEFSCFDGKCSLAELWTDSTTGYEVRHRKPLNSEELLVILRPDKEQSGHMPQAGKAKTE